MERFTRWEELAHRKCAPLLHREDQESARNVISLKNNLLIYVSEQFAHAKIDVVKASFFYDLPTAPERWEDSHPVVMTAMPIWLRVSAAARLSSRSRKEIEDFIKCRLVQVAWRRDKAGRPQALIYAPSLWRHLDSLVEQPQEPALQ